MQLSILVPIDFSPANQVIYSLIAQLGQAVPVRVTLVHAATNSSVRPGPQPEAVQAPLPISEALETEGHRIQLENCQTESVLIPKTRNPAKAIAKMANHGRYDLIFTAHRFRRGAAEYVMGSTLSKLVRLCDVPILVLTEGHLPKLNTLLFTTDFAPESTKALFSLLPYARKLKARIVVVRINTGSDWLPERDFREHAQEMKDMAADNGPAFAQHLEEQLVGIYSYNARSIAQGIVHCAEDHQCDAIVMATHARSGFSLMMNGSVTKEVIEHTPMPVLIFKVEELAQITAD
ncbi:MAG: universal stress protein [Sphingobacteriia bacterium]